MFGYFMLCGFIAASTIGQCTDAVTGWCQAHGWPTLLTRALIYAGVPVWLVIGAATFLTFAVIFGYEQFFGSHDQSAGMKAARYRRPPTRWIAWMVAALIWGGIDGCLWFNSHSTPDQAMPFDLTGFLWLAWTFGGAALLGLSAIVLFIYGFFARPSCTASDCPELKPAPPPRGAIITIIFLAIEAISAITALINALLKLRQRSGRLTTNETRRLNHLLAKQKQLQGHAVALGCKPGGELDSDYDNPACVG